jgi:Tol biopolymer transport system component
LRPAISADGRFVVFASLASNLAARDTNGTCDVFVHDLLRRTTRRVSSVRFFRQPDGCSHGARLSSDGWIIAFSSEASNLVRDDRNGEPDVFVRRR